MTTITIKAIVKVSETAAETETNTATETAAETETAKTDKYAVDNTAFDTAVDELIKLQANEFMELVTYAKRHGNQFPSYSKFSHIVNADDAYCTAIINMTRLWSKEVEDKAFEVFNGCSSDKVIRMLTVLKSAYTAARDSGGDVQTYYCLKEVVDAYMSTL